MFRKWWFWLGIGILALVVLGTLIGGAFMAFRMSGMRGSMWGYVPSPNEGAQPYTQPPGGYIYPMRPFSMLRHGVFGLIRCGFFLAFIALLVCCLRSHAHHRWVRSPHGSWKKHWAAHAKHWHGGPPPWFAEEEATETNKAEGTPDVDA